jgi:RNA polymerase sigma-70 factor (ECF subfamily)
MTGLATQTIKKTKTLTIFQRIENKDQTAVQECVDRYGNFIWALARKFTNSSEEAEAATREIFIDIWRYARCGEKTQSDEKILISLIARRRLIKYLN